MIHSTPVLEAIAKKFQTVLGQSLERQTALLMPIKAKKQWHKKKNC